MNLRWVHFLLQPSQSQEHRVGVCCLILLLQQQVSLGSFGLQHSLHIELLLFCNCFKSFLKCFTSASALQSLSWSEHPDSVEVNDEGSSISLVCSTIMIWCSTGDYVKINFKKTYRVRLLELELVEQGSNI